MHNTNSKRTINERARLNRFSFRLSFIMQYASASVFNQQYPFASSLFDIEAYFGEFAWSLGSRPTLKLTPENFNSKKDFKSFEDDFFMNNLQIPADHLAELKKITSTDQLSCEEELEPWSAEASEFQNNLEKSIPNNSLATLKEEVEKKQKTKNSEFSLKYKECTVLPNYQPKNYMINLNPFDFKTVIISVRIYSPFVSQRNAYFKVKLLQEIYLLGHQYLCDLKDQIKCNLDHLNLRDVSDDCFLKDVGSQVSTKSSYPSSFIFIENTFYNDNRSDKMIDLSEITRDWLHSRKLGPFSVSTMNEKPISEIPLKVGHPYVYQHQGNCEHIILFSDFRFLNSCDDIKSRCYPKVHSIGYGYAKHCMMCTAGYAKWVVKENKRLTHDRTFLCNRCFKSYNYINNAKVGEFAAYEYIDPIAIL